MSNSDFAAAIIAIILCAGILLYVSAIKRTEEIAARGDACPHETLKDLMEANIEAERRDYPLP